MSAFTPVLEPTKRDVTFKEVLLATDFSQASEAALRFAVAVSCKHNAELLVVHALPSPPKVAVPLDPLPRALDRRLLEAESQMNRVAEIVRSAGVSCRTRIAQGEVWDVLSAAMLRQSTDLLVLGTHGRGALKKLALGSVAEEVLRLADCPVLTVGPRVNLQSSEDIGLHTILFATDFGPASIHALPLAVSLAQNSDARLVLVHMLPPMPLADAAYAPAVFAADDLLQWREAVRAESEKKLKALIPPGALARKPKCLVGTDFLPEGILSVAAEHDADLIVMGANRAPSPRVAAHIPWSLTHHIICDACCPVLTVRA